MTRTLQNANEIMQDRDIIWDLQHLLFRISYVSCLFMFPLFFLCFWFFHPSIRTVISKTEKKEKFGHQANRGTAPLFIIHRTSVPYRCVKTPSFVDQFSHVLFMCFFRNFYLFKTVVKFQCSVSLNLWVWIPRWLIEPTCSCSLKPQFCCFKSPLIVLGDAVPMISGYTMIYFHSYLGNIMLFASLWRSITMVLYLCK